MAEREILLLGDPRLLQVSRAVTPDEFASLEPLIDDLHDTLMAFRRRWGAGRAVAAPQIGDFRRVVYLHLGEPRVLVNPRLARRSTAMIEVWDDCMSFPELLVKVRRHKQVSVAYQDQEAGARRWRLQGDLAELLQHELDHLDGVLAVARAVDGHSFALRSQAQHTSYDRSGLPPAEAQWGATVRRED
jgi:peptide deformylase